MSVNVWAFLVSRNPYLDYRTAVAPDFICQAKISSLLARAADGEANDPGKGYFRKVIGSKVGDFFIIFRVVLATQKDIVVGELVNETSSRDTAALKDLFGREIYLVKGIVTRTFENPKQIFLSSQDIEQVHQPVAQAYGQFWQLEEAQLAVPSPAISIPLLEPSFPSLELEELPPLVCSDLAPSIDRNTPKPFQPQVDIDQHTLEQNRLKNRPMQSAVSSMYERRRQTEDRSTFLSKLALIAAGTALLALIALALVTKGNVFGRSGVNLCTNVRSEPLVLMPDTIPKKELNAFKRQFLSQEQSIFVSGSLPLNPNDRLLRKNSSLSKRDPLVGAGRTKIAYSVNGSVFHTEKYLSYTLVPDMTGLRLLDHPLDLLIAQLGNQKIEQRAYLQIKTILRQKC
jgi:hypothetical protein